MPAKNFIKKLTDAFTKSEKSNIGKLFIIVDKQITDLTNTLEKAEEWRDIDYAEGKTLNSLGENVGQNRGQASDEVYRVLIRGKVARNASDGTINKMIHAIAKSLNCAYSDIQIVNANDSVSTDEHEPAAIIIKKIPLSALNSVGLSTSQFLQLVTTLKPAGVRVAYVSLEGSFSFAKATEVETSQTGFSDINQVIGGTLGGLFTPENDYKLPI
ncbi:DUF2612 domain-containing protein [Listeria seeligeri]|uniref:hypothetical protein n=1 Tax=Listeria TaxID=1637 RepID=UPI0015DBA7FB|nr:MULTISPECIES: hypothetical protein [Listeria]MBC1850189.1 DUF2612 domain-containing protein [Listeria seeligeri]MBC1850263.1 DUF2612 domain-containing protein [Listeria seeligeri]MBF2533456.1 hypothetical protein [Listeria seeligeri]MBF2624850.1 hypothetical protein [Listeria seeligeri]HAO6121908.1 DUF2612 domain-containing protein [Listeria monocytogenes]